MAQLLESCKKTQQKAVAIHPTAPVLSLVPGPPCVNTLTVLFQYAQGRQKRGKRGARKGRDNQTLDQGYQVPQLGHRYKEHDHARRRPQRLHLPVQQGTQPTFVIYSAAPSQAEGLRLLRKLRHASPLNVSSSQWETSSSISRGSSLATACNGSATLEISSPVKRDVD